ncbi:MAG: hypothetical protein HY785_21250 [Oscillatoriophycideae cyanobacterium NC_groundwater_1537_Pr4_S-0.65um_50_18]|nr:hypothetical protein [Oscillatoriophycideae cyanobacterium NC_groundwater_1537_Pr4_S-0.65um_50_18]
MNNAFQSDHADPISHSSSFIAPDFVILPEPGLPDVPKEKGDRELLYVLVIGFEAGVMETLYELQRRGFANVTDWSRNLPRPEEFPQPRSGEVMRILQRYRLRG